MESVFLELDFLSLVMFSIVLPIGIYIYLMRKQAISRKTVLLFGVILIGIAAVDIFLLQHMTALAKASPSQFDDKIFASEFLIALYLMPGLFAGIVVNMLSHILLGHLVDAERRFNHEHR